MNKKLLIAIIFFVIVVGGALIATLFKNRTLNYTNDPLLNFEAERNPALFVDTDNDGLKDWEEDLWKTDKSDSDTDKDGVSDFEEVRNGRNPLVAGPNDILDPEEFRNKVNQAIESDLTETDKFSRLLFSKYISGMNDGPPNTAEYADFLIDYAIQAENGDISLKENSDFKIMADTEQNMKNYGNALGKLIREQSEKHKGNEIEILESAINAESSKKMEGLNEPIARYRGIEAGMAQMQVPQSFVSTHTKLTNLIGLMAFSVENMKYLLDDPVKGLGGVSMYPDSADLMARTMGELKNLFLIKKIVFNSKEDGYLITGSI